MTASESSVKAMIVAQLLAGAYPEARCELDYRSPWQLLVATVLSAQCTDVRVNQTTPAFFARWPGPAELAAAEAVDVEAVIRHTGLYRNKARSLQQTARDLVAEHDGQVPASFEDLVALPGVGPKTAKVILGEGFGIAAGVAVDTHVRRVTQRLGLCRAEDPEKVAAELETALPRESWVSFSLRAVLHGRRVCTARMPRCGECTLEPVCDKKLGR
jgi:endonuclease-3